MKIIKKLLIAAFVLAFGMFAISCVKKLGGRDLTVPEIVSDRDVLEISCEYTEEDLLEGLTATDEKDGDLTSQIIPGTFSRFIEKGVSNLTYVVFDSANQPGTLTRKVKFTDYHSPRFTLTEPLVFAEGEGGYNEVMKRLGASDALDGSLKEGIVQTDTEANYSKAGAYTVTMQVSNSYGDTSTADLPVHVLSPENQSADIELTEGIVYIEAGTKIKPGDYVERVTDTDGNELSKDTVDVNAGVDADTPGVYEIHYEAQDSSGNTGETWLTVIVEEKGGAE